MGRAGRSSESSSSSRSSGGGGQRSSGGRIGVNDSNSSRSSQTSSSQNSSSNFNKISQRPSSLRDSSPPGPQYTPPHRSFNRYPHIRHRYPYAPPPYSSSYSPLSNASYSGSQRPIQSPSLRPAKIIKIIAFVLLCLAFLGALSSAVSNNHLITLSTKTREPLRNYITSRNEKFPKGDRCAALLIYY